MSRIEIREASPEDAGILLEYMKQVGGESDNLTYGSEGMPLTLEQEQAFLQMQKEDKRSLFLCAWKDDALVGTASLSALLRRMQHRAELGISVVKAEWGHGIGSMLMERLISHARGNGIEIINLEVRSDNRRALHLYEKYGFRHIGTSPAFLKIGGAYVDFQILYLDLRQAN